MNEINKEKLSEKTTFNSNNQPHAEIEAEYVPLFSKGLYYKGNFKGLDKLLVRKLDWTDEDILTTKSYYDNGTLFDVLLKRCIVDDCGFNVMDLISIDRDAILWWLRIGAFGADYEIPITCKQIDPSTDKICGRKNKIVWNLKDFERPNFPEIYAKEIEATGGVIIELPSCQLKCKIIVPSIGRLKEIDKAQKEKKAKTKVTNDFNSTTRLLSVIEEVYDKEGNSTKKREDIFQWLMKGNNGKPISISDSRYIIKKAEEINLKINTKKTYICDCGYEHTTNMVMTVYFFYPDFDELIENLTD